MRMKWMAGSLAVAAGLVSATASAGYFGLSVGQATLKDWPESINDGSVTFSDSEDSDTAFRIMGGMDLTPNFKLELGYSDFGEATAEGNSDGSGFIYPAGPVDVTAAVSGIDLTAVGKMAVSDSFSLFLKAGVLKWDIDVDVSISGGSGSASEDGNDTFIGFGAELATSRTFALRGDYTLYSVDSEDVNTLMLSLIFRSAR